MEDMVVEFPDVDNQIAVLDILVVVLCSSGID